MRNRRDTRDFEYDDEFDYSDDDRYDDDFDDYDDDVDDRDDRYDDEDDDFDYDGDYDDPDDYDDERYDERYVNKRSDNKRRNDDRYDDEDPYDDDYDDDDRYEDEDEDQYYEEERYSGRRSTGGRGRNNRRDDDRYRDDRYDDDDDRYDDDYDDEDEGDGKGMIPKWAHFAALGVIAVVIIFSVVKILIWNKGTDLKYDPGEGSDYEIMDNIFPADSEALAGREDDGKDTILFVGNDSITYDSGETGVVGQIQKITGATCINAGFPKSTVARKNASYSGDYPLDAFCFASVMDAVASGDYSTLHDAANSSDSVYADQLSVLESVDFDKVDTLVIYYDAQDYIDLRTGLNPENDVDEVTYKGALASGLNKFKEKYPYIRIVGMSMTWCYAFDSSGEVVSGDKKNFGNDFVTGYYQHMMDVCEAKFVSFIDNYYGTVDDSNSSEMLVDNIHTGEACNKHIAEHFAEKIYEISGDNAEEKEE